MNSVEQLWISVLAGLPAQLQPIGQTLLAILLTLGAIAGAVDAILKLADRAPKSKQTGNRLPIPILRPRVRKGIGRLATGSLIFVAVCFIALGSAAVTSRLSATPPLGTDGCRIGAPPNGAIAVIVDVSDPLSQLEKAVIIERIEAAVQTADEYTWFALFSFRSGELERNYQRCVPRLPRNANPIIDNPQAMQLEYEEQFAGQVRTEMHETLDSREALYSPLADAFTDVAGSPRFQASSGRQTLIMVSDGVVNTREFSLYREDATFRTFLSTDQASRMRPLSGAEIVWVRTGRIVRADVASRTEQFWTDFAEYYGATLVVR